MVEEEEEGKKIEEKIEKEYEEKTLSLYYKKIGTNWVSYLPNGKVVLVDKSQKNKLVLEEGRSYQSLIKKEVAKTAFSIIVSETFLPKILMFPDYLMLIEKEESKEKRIYGEFKEIINECMSRKIRKINLIITEKYMEEEKKKKDKHKSDKWERL